jgi:hypothetical protein
VDLPEAEDPAAWAHALALAGLEPGDPGAGAGARVTVQGARWTVSVRDERGQVHTLTVAAPDDRASREALASTIASLVHPVSIPTVALPPLPPTPAPRRPPAPRPVPPPDPEPVAVVPEPDPAKPEPIVVPEPQPRGPPRPLVELDDPPALRRGPTLAWWAGAGPAIRFRSRVRSAAAAEAWFGALADERWRVGLGLGGAAPSEWTSSVGSFQVEMADLRGLVGASPGPWDLGLTGGGSLRRVEGLEADRVPLFGVVGATAGYRIPMGPVSLRPGLLIERDTRASLVGVAHDPADELDRWSGELTISVWTR